MGFKKAILVLLLLIILTMGAASAADTNTTSDNLAANEDTSVKLSENNDFEDKLGIESSNHISDTGNSTGKLTDLENVMSLTKDNHKEDKSYDDILSAQNDLNVLNTNYGTYSGLATEIGSGGNIELNCDYYTYDSGSTIEITDDNSVIDGKGAIIDMAGSPSMRAFEVTASGVTIKNLTIKNANYTGDGGAIYFSNSGTVTNCNFTNNSASVYGGAVYFYKSSTVTNCNFTNNTASSKGGAVYFLNTGTVSNCNFTNNSDSGGGGGAVYFSDSGTVTNCNFTNNTGSVGGAIFFAREGNASNCNFTNNTSDSEGGAICFLDKYTKGNVTNCNFTDNEAYDGGAISFRGEGIVSNCNFTDNQASRYGGAVYFLVEGSVANCNFTNNTASESGGAVYFRGEGSVANSNFTNNTANSEGGAIFFYSKYNEGNVTNCNFTDNEAYDGGAIKFNVKGIVSNCNFTDNQASRYGGAVYFWNYGTVSNCNFTDNQATYDGGAVYFDIDGIVSNCNFTDNQASRYGGAVYFDSNSDGNVTNCNFINCSAELGKAILANSNTLISNCNFETQGSERLSELVMGGIISNCTVNGKKEKTATNMTIITEDITYGENATITVTMTTDGTVTVNINNQNIGLEITNGTRQIIIPNLNVGEYIVKASFEGNSDYESANATTTLTVKSNMKTFEDITSLIGSAYAGDIINLEGTYYGTGSTITINKELTIKGNGESILDAKNLSGILSVSANNVRINNIRFVNGKINANGGAINWIGKNGTISNCTFINCSAENGGSVYWNAENGMINTSTFDKSTATQNGGAIYWNANSGEIANSIFTNSHAQNGGAVYVPENRNVEIKSSIFDSNIAEEESGAVYGGTVDDDCTFKNNTYTPVNTKTFISINETAVYVGNDILITTLILNNDKGVLVNTGTVEIYINSTLMATIPANTQYIHTTGEIGKYQVLAKFIDDSSYKNSSSTAEFTVIPVDIPEEIETNNEGIFTLEFPDDAEGTLTVFIDGVKYKVYDIVGGILTIDLSYKKGKYNITFEYSGDKNYPAFKKDANMTVETNPSIKASNAKVLYSAGTTYKITVYKNKGILAKSVSVTIKLNNKKLKPIKTNSKGIASFKATQTPGTYKLKITTLGKTVTKTLTVKHIVTLKAVKVKKSAKKLILQATLAKVNKKYLKKKTVTFKFNGKKYKAKTNAKGVAKVTIKKSVLKKLKVGKKVTYQATYLKDTVKKTAKIKK